MLEAFDFALVTATIKRGKEGHYLDGVWIPSFEAPVTLQIIRPLPLRSQELEMLPDGERQLNYMKTYIEAAVKTRENLQDSDIISFEGKNYKVMQLSPYTLEGQTVYRVVIREIRIDET
jgi:hypothetical protein